MTAPKKRTAVKAVAAEAAEDDGNLTFEYDGNEYTVRKNLVRNIEFLEAYEDDKMVTSMRWALGPQQWAAFKASKDEVLEDDLIDMANEMFRALVADKEK